MLTIITDKETYKIPSGIEDSIGLHISHYICTMSNDINGFKNEKKLFIRFRNWNRGVLNIEEDGQISFRNPDYSDEFINELIFIDRIIKEKFVEIKRKMVVKHGFNIKYNWNEAMHATLSDISYIRSKRLELILD